MKSFKIFLTETNEIIPANASGNMDHRTGPLGQFLSFVHGELPYVDRDFDSDHMYVEELGRHIKKMLSDDPTHIQEFHRSLTVDDDDDEDKNTPKKADLYDALYKLTRDVVPVTRKRYKKEKGVDLSSDELTGIKDEVTKHMSERGAKVIRAQIRNNPKWRHISDISDIEI